MSFRRHREYECHSPRNFGLRCPHEISPCSDACRQLWCGCSWPARSEKGTVSGDRAEARRTHIEDMEDPAEVQFPSGDGPRIILRVKELGDRIPPTPFDDVPLDFCNGPGIESTVGGGIRNAYLWLSSRRQLIYRIASRPVKLIQPPSIHPPVEGSTYVCAGQPEFDVVQFVERGILATCELWRVGCRTRGNVPLSS